MELFPIVYIGTHIPFPLSFEHERTTVHFTQHHAVKTTELHTCASLQVMAPPISGPVALHHVSCSATPASCFCCPSSARTWSFFASLASYPPLIFSALLQWWSKEICNPSFFFWHKLPTVQHLEVTLYVPDVRSFNDQRNCLPIEIKSV